MRESDRAIKENDVPLLRESTGITGSTKPISIPQNEPGEPGRPRDTRGNARGNDRSDAGGNAGARMEAKCLWASRGNQRPVVPFCGIFSEQINIATERRPRYG